MEARWWCRYLEQKAVFTVEEMDPDPFIVRMLLGLPWKVVALAGPVDF